MNSSREIVPLQAADISSFCKNLRQQLADAGVSPVPGHLAFLNLLAKSAGHRNYQALRVSAPAPSAVSAAREPMAIASPRGSTLPRAALRALTHFDTAGRLRRWPTQFAVQQYALWGLWIRLPLKRDMSEADVNRHLDAYHCFGDAATLRRELVNAKLLWRTIDCRLYRKEPRRRSDEANDFLEALVAACETGPGRQAR
ncbi:MAG: DUF2087 domain-containing protein [Betaproteobacteria bacterium]|nr:DUF2087 domain-containing protein [Betaproteobacteria bacterium]